MKPMYNVLREKIPDAYFFYRHSFQRGEAASKLLDLEKWLKYKNCPFLNEEFSYVNKILKNHLFREYHKNWRIIVVLC
jgi:hypothetical protein